MNSDSHNLIAFKAIATLVANLSKQFGSQFHSIRLYEKLLSKTTFLHDKAIQKHIDTFKNFCTNNRQAILSKDVSKVDKTLIEYSPKIFIDFTLIFKKATSEQAEVVLTQLINISNIIDPSGSAKEALKNDTENTQEADFLSSIISKVEKQVSQDSSPTDAVSTILNSGLFNELVSGMNENIKSGNLDLGKLMGTVQKMCTSLNTETSETCESPPDLDNLKLDEISEDDSDLDDLPNLEDAARNNII